MYFCASRKKNLILVKKSINETLSKLQLTSFEIKARETFNAQEALLFEASCQNSEAIVFNKSLANLNHRFKKNLILENVETAGWTLLSYGNSTLLIKNVFPAKKINAAKNKGLYTHPFYHLNFKEINTLNLKNLEKRVVTVLAMQQYASFMAYAHEITKFLLIGTDVLAYDHPGVALSEGNSSKDGLREAVFSIADFLIQQLKFKQEQIIFKGQCAGEIAISEVWKQCPNSHLSPQNYWGATKSFLNDTKENIKYQTGLKNRIKYPFFALGATCGTPISYMMKMALPNFDVVENLKKMQGLKIYTIGVPDEDGNGGDNYVPKMHQQNIKKILESENEGYFLEIPGIAHVTNDWWCRETVNKKIYQIFKEKNLTYGPFNSAVDIEKDEELLPQTQTAVPQKIFSTQVWGLFKSLLYPHKG